MKKSTCKLFRAMCGMIAMLALVASIAPMQVFALTNGIYIATASPHYKHPETGEIEDSGGSGSSVLGQSMTESATYEQALVEVDPDGNTYITVRLQLMDNIQNPQFQVDGEPVSASITQENYGDLSENNTADFRMKVNSEDSIIRCNMYVIAMGREVVFYITVSDLQPGSGDFVTNVEVIEQGTVPAEDDTRDETEVAAEETEAEQSGENQNDEPVGLQEYDASGNLVTDEETEDAQRVGSSSMIGWIVGGAAVVAVVVFAIWYFCFFKKK